MAPATSAVRPARRGRRCWNPGSWRDATAFIAETRGSGFAGAGRWVPKVLAALDKYAEDDNVAAPALALLAAFAGAAPEDVDHVRTDQQGRNQQKLDGGVAPARWGQDAASADAEVQVPANCYAARRQMLCEGFDCVGIVQRVLQIHSRIPAVQAEGWDLVCGFAREPSLQPLLTRRGGVQALAQRFERFDCGHLCGPVRSSVASVLAILADVAGCDALPSGAGAGTQALLPQVTRCDHCAREVAGMLTCGRCRAVHYCDRTCQRAAWRSHRKACEAVEGYATAAAASTQKSGTAAQAGVPPPQPGHSRGGTAASERSRQICLAAVVKLERATRQHDSMVVDKVLRQLIQKIRSREVACEGLEKAGVGPVLGELVDFQGDADIRELASTAIREVARLQIAEPIR